MTTGFLCGKRIWTISVVVSVGLAVHIVELIYFWRYGYSNPDPQSCFYVEGLETTGKTRLEATTKAIDVQVTVPTGYPIDMAHLFRIWFIWGFWDKIYQTIAFLPVLYLHLTNKRVSLAPKVALGILVSLSMLNLAVWIIIGLFWRFSKAGRVTSGEYLSRAEGTSDTLWQESLQGASKTDGYQLSGGKFMLIYLGILALSLILLLVGVSLTLLIYCCLRANDKKS